MMRAGALLGSVGLAVTLLAACSSQPVQAPVIERAPSGAVLPPSPPAGARSDAYYTVRRGDTLFSIALDHGLDYKDLAAWNNIDNPNRIRSGQQLRIKPPAGAQEATVTVHPVTSSGPVEVRPLGASASQGAARPGASARHPGAGHGRIRSGSGDCGGRDRIGAYRAQAALLARERGAVATQ